MRYLIAFLVALLPSTALAGFGPPPSGGGSTITCAGSGLVYYNGSAYVCDTHVGTDGNGNIEANSVGANQIGATDLYGTTLHTTGIDSPISEITVTGTLYGPSSDYVANSLYAPQVNGNDVEMLSGGIDVLGVLQLRGEGGSGAGFSIDGPMNFEGAYGIGDITSIGNSIGDIYMGAALQFQGYSIYGATNVATNSIYGYSGDLAVNSSINMFNNDLYGVRGINANSLYADSISDIGYNQTAGFFSISTGNSINVYSDGPTNWESAGGVSIHSENGYSLYSNPGTGSNASVTADGFLTIAGNSGVLAGSDVDMQGHTIYGAALIYSPNVELADNVNSADHVTLFIATDTSNVTIWPGNALNLQPGGDINITPGNDVLVHNGGHNFDVTSYARFNSDFVAAAYVSLDGVQWPPSPPTAGQALIASSPSLAAWSTLPDGNITPNDGTITFLSSQNNVSNFTGKWHRVTPSNAGLSITGIVAASDGKRLRLTNIGPNSITLANQSSSSTAANRIITSTGADLTLAVDQTIDLIYDTTTARWRRAL